ncbi:MAG: hypothetical protein LBR99_03630 [Treponema sp.]|nr:hypothetical protein [Treponema sp.]
MSSGRWVFKEFFDFLADYFLPWSGSSGFVSVLPDATPADAGHAPSTTRFAGEGG